MTSTASRSARAGRPRCCSAIAGAAPITSSAVSVALEVLAKRHRRVTIPRQQGEPMEEIHFTYLNGPDIAALDMTDGEILDAVEGGLRAQGDGQAVIEPRV